MDRLPLVDMKSTGKRIKTLRQDADLRLHEASKILGVSVQSICKWERGDNLPSIDNLVILAALFGVKLDDIVITVI